MESTSRKRRYSRYNNPLRNNKNQDEFIRNLAKQIVVCCIVFFLIIGIKNINTSFTNQVTNQIRKVLGYTISFNNAYKSADVFARNIGFLRQSQQDKSHEEEKENLDVLNKMTPKQGLLNTSGDNKESSITLDGNNLAGVLSMDLSGKIPTEAIMEKTNIEQSMVVPVKGVVTSKFGMRHHPLFQKDIFHYGIDIDALKGSNIVTVMDGIVAEIGQNNNYGRYVIIKHQNEIDTLYAHCDTITVKKDEAVKRGDVLGKIGNTGMMLGIHLHFEIMKNGRSLDPLNYLDLPVHPLM